MGRDPQSRADFRWAAAGASVAAMVSAFPGSTGGAREPRVKGVSFKSVMAVYTELKGAPALDAALASLTAEQAEELRYRVVATHWYPIPLYRALLGAIVDTSGGGAELVKTIGYRSTQRDMTGVHRFAFKLLSPTMVLAVTNRLFGTYYDTGTAETVESRPGFARARFQGCRGFDRWMWTELLGSTEVLFELAGAQHVRPRWVKGGDDSPDAELVVHWADA